jgi:hypothetical protein
VTDGTSECNPNHEKHDDSLSPKLQSFASLLDTQPPEVQEAFQFLLATAMHEAGKFDLQLVVSRKGATQ